jgi:uncharacterized membrane protein
MSDWYYAADNEQKGPINESELKANLASNKLPADTLVWKDGMDNWTPASQVPAFSFRPAPTPATVQPGAAAMASTKADPDVNNPDSTKPIDMKSLVGTPEALEVNAEDAEANTMFGILAYLGPLCFVPLISAPGSPYAKYHANQGAVLFLLWITISIVLYVVSIIVAMLPGFLGFLDAVFGLLYRAPLALLIFGMINAAACKCVPLPVIGGIRLLK